jgi:hypothetical protein
VAVVVRLHVDDRLAGTVVLLECGGRGADVLGGKPGAPGLSGQVGRQALHGLTEHVLLRERGLRLEERRGKSAEPGGDVGVGQGDDAAVRLTLE